MFCAGCFSYMYGNYTETDAAEYLFFTEYLVCMCMCVGARVAILKWTDSVLCRDHNYLSMMFGDRRIS